MSFTVCWTGKEVSFSSKDHARAYQDRLNVGSDLWFGTNLLLRSRIKQPDGSFKVIEYTYN